MTENLIEIKEEQQEMVEETKPVTTDEAKEAGWSKEEIQMGVENGTLSEKETQEQPEEEAEDEQPEEKAVEDSEEQDNDSDDEEDVEESDSDDDEGDKDTSDFNANEKALYWKQKRERKKRQAAERKAELLEAKLKAYQEISEKKETPDTQNEDNEEGFITKADLKKQKEEEAKKQEERRLQAEAINARLEAQYEEAKAEYENFDELCDLAKEVMDEDESGVYATKLQQATVSENGNPAQVAYQISRLHPDFDKVAGKKEKVASKKKTDKKKVNKVMANAKKRSSSAALGGGAGGSRKVSEDELTPEDVVHMDQEQWNSLTDKTRKRLLKA